MEIARNNLNSIWMEVLSIKMCQILHIQTPIAIKHTKRDKKNTNGYINNEYYWHDELCKFCIMIGDKPYFLQNYLWKYISNSLLNSIKY